MVLFYAQISKSSTRNAAQPARPRICLPSERNRRNFNLQAEASGLNTGTVSQAALAQTQALTQTQAQAKTQAQIQTEAQAQTEAQSL